MTLLLHTLAATVLTAATVLAAVLAIVTVADAVAVWRGRR